LSPIKSAITTVLVCTAAALSLSLPTGAIAASASSTPSLLQPADLAKLVPATVFFRGQVASTQMRNSGGVKMSEPAGDLAVALAVASARNDRPLRPGVVAIGEVGLAGEVRRVEGVGRRLTEAARLGFTLALVPPDSGPVPPGVHSIEVSHVREAIQYAVAPNS